MLRLIYFLILKRSTFALFSLMDRSLTWSYQLRFVSIFTPTYLTPLVGYRLLPHNFIFKSPKFLLLRLKDYNFFFCFTLIEILFEFNQLTRCVKFELTSLFSFLIELLRHKKLVSSAKWWNLQELIAWLRSFIYNKNRRGPGTDPWGTLQFKVVRPESKPFMGTYWLRLGRYDLN